MSSSDPASRARARRKVARLELWAAARALAAAPFVFRFVEVAFCLAAAALAAGTGGEQRTGCANSTVTPPLPPSVVTGVAGAVHGGVSIAFLLLRSGWPSMAASASPS